MAKIDANLIREVRDKTGAPVMRAKQVLEETGDKDKAIEILKKEGFEKAAKRSDRATGQGFIGSYIHHSGKIGAMVELLTETDFVAKNDLFKNLASELAMQVASMNAADTKELMEQDYIKDPDRKIEDLVKEVIAKTGENVQIGKITRIEIGSE